MRNNIWLECKLEKIWQDYFSDIPRKNDIKIKFGRNARTRLGSIRFIVSMSHFARPGLAKAVPDSLITLTGYFQDERVPEYIIDTVIAHELCHYAHGFSSPLPQLASHPHRGGVVDNELKRRGLGDELKKQKLWLENEWKNIIGPVKRRRRIRRKKTSFLKFLIS